MKLKKVGKWIWEMIEMSRICKKCKRRGVNISFRKEAPKKPKSWKETPYYFCNGCLTIYDVNGIVYADGIEMTNKVLEPCGLELVLKGDNRIHVEWATHGPKTVDHNKWSKY